MWKKITSRLHILNGGKAAYQKFLSKLPPQVVLLYFAIVLGTKLDLNRFDPNNLSVTSAFFIMLVAFGLAAWVNISTFYKSFTGRFQRSQRLIGVRLDRNGVTGSWRRSMARTGAIVKRKRIEVIEILLVQFFLQVALAIVVTQAIQKAASVLPT